MNCCDDLGQCTQGTGCPVRATASTCHQAGVCQHPVQSCRTHCDMPIIMLGEEPIYRQPPQPGQGSLTVWGHITRYIAIGLVCVIMTGLIVGGLSFLWHRYPEPIKRAFGLVTSHTLVDKPARTVQTTARPELAGTAAA